MKVTALLQSALWSLAWILLSLSSTATAFVFHQMHQPPFFRIGSPTIRATTGTQPANIDPETLLRMSSWDTLEQKLLSVDASASTASSIATKAAKVVTAVPNVVARTPPPTPVIDSTSAADILSDLLKSARTVESYDTAASVATTTAATTAVTAPPSLLDQTSTNAQSLLESVRELSSLRSTDMMVETTTATKTAQAASFAVGNYIQSIQEQSDYMAGANAAASTRAVEGGYPAPDLHELEATIRSLLEGAPPGEGLAKPIVDFVMTTLHDLRDSPYNPPNWIQVGEMPRAYTTTSNGFQVKQAVVQAMADASQTAVQTAAESKVRLDSLAPQMVENFNTFVAPSAPLRASMVQALRLDSGGVLGSFKTSYTTTAPLRASVGDALRTKMTATGSLAASAGSSISAALKNSVDRLALVQGDLERLLRTPGWRPEDVLTTLNMKELGPFYIGVAVAMLLAVSYANNSNNEQGLVTSASGMGPGSNKKSSSNVTSPRANKTAAPKAPAASGAKRGGEQDQLENIVADLTQATAILATEMKGMAADLRQLKQQSSVVAAPPVFQSTAAVVPPATPIRPAVVAVKKAEEDELTKMLRELETQNELLRVQLNNAKFEADTLYEVNEALNAGVATLSGLSKSPVIPQSFPSLEELGLADAYFIAGSAAVNGNGSVQQQQQQQASPTTATTAVMDAPDWSNLSLSAIKKKTEAELKDYLASKGIQSKDTNGRPLKKPDLLALVMDIA